MDVEFALAAVGAVVGLTTGVVAVIQYIRARRWKRSEFAARLLMQLHDDPELALACKILDWSHRKLRIPEVQKLTDDEDTFTHTPEKLASAMRPHQQQDSFTREGVIYRDTFDRFFTYLEQVEHFVSRDLIGIDDVAPLAYWLDAVRKPFYAKEPPFDRFLEVYEYSGVQSLRERFDAPEKEERS